MKVALEKVSDDELVAELLRRKNASIERLKGEISELEKTLAEKRRELEGLGERDASPVSRRPRRPSISDENLSKQIFKVLNGDKKGMNATEIGAAVNQHNIRISKFFKNQTGEKGQFRRQGIGRSTLYFIR